tara:strand:- start:8 stop:1309 length:1302 start_codon:yes stop_codon:yes gene_type:complete
MDDELQRVLELSAREARERASKPLELPRSGNNSGVSILRRSLAPPLEHHFAARRGAVHVRGALRSRGALDQFSSAFGSLIDQHGVAGSICGYVTASNVDILCRALIEPSIGIPHRGVLQERHIDALLAAVSARATVLPLIDRSMGVIGAKRRAYVASHPREFPGGPRGTLARDFFRGWVANYELSDLMQRDALLADAEMASAPPRYFARFNQFPLLSDATPDEAARIQRDEARFGGRILAAGITSYKAGDSEFMIERFGSARALQTPKEWLAAEEEGRGTGGLGGEASVRVFALDLNGHYSCCFTCRVADADAGADAEVSEGELGTPTLVLVNSTETRYVDHTMCTALFDLLFPPDAEELAARAEGNVFSASQLAALIAMGFDEAASRAALVTARGDIDAAVATLLGAAPTSDAEREKATSCAPLPPPPQVDS